MLRDVYNNFRARVTQSGEGWRRWGSEVVGAVVNHLMVRLNTPFAFIILLP